MSYLLMGLIILSVIFNLNLYISSLKLVLITIIYILLSFIYNEIIKTIYIMFSLYII
jgi:hypothetical protein